jgi:uncharacterized protein (DUF697 family)
MSNGVEKEKQLEEIIKNFATAAATSSAAFGVVGMLNLDFRYASIIHIGMVQEIGKLFDCNIDKKQAMSIIARAMTVIGAGIVATAVVSWVPIVGSAINATTTFTYTQKLGRWVYLYFLNNRDSLNCEPSSGD